MWSPTHVQVTVYRARNLLIKGKSGTNDAYVTIKLAEEKYQTSIKERSTTPEWMEECDLPMGEMTDTIYLNVHHRNLLGIDEFLGHVDIGLDQFKIYERPRSRWYALGNKPGSKKAEKYRGEIEIKVTFIVQSDTSNNPALARVGKGFKRSSSIKTLAHSVGEKLTTGKWPSKGSLSNKSGSRPDLSSTMSDSGDQSPTVRKLDKRDLTRSHTILPTSFNNQHLQEEASSYDDVDSTGTNEDAKGHDLERWTNPLAPFRRKKKSRLSKMNILSQSSLTLDTDKSPPGGDLDNDGELKGLEPMLHKPLLAKSMFDLSTTTIDEFSGEPPGVQHSDSEHEVENESESGKSSSHRKLNHSKSDKDRRGRRLPSTPGGALPEDDIVTSNSPLHSDMISTNGETTHERGIDVDFNSSPAKVTTPSNADLKTFEATNSGKEDEANKMTELSVIKEQPQSEPEVALEPDTRAIEVKVIEPKVTDSPTVDMHTADRGETSAPFPDVDETKISQITETFRQKSLSSESSSSDTDDEGVSTESSPDSKRLSGSKFKEVTPSKVTEDKATAEKTTDKPADRADKYKRMKEVNRRHTVRHNVARAAAHDLHAGILEYKRAQEERERPLPIEVMDQFNDHSREDLVRLILEQRQMLHKKDTYNRDLEDYIDNLLVKVMEVTPKLLAHPSTRPSPPKTHRSTINGTPRSPTGSHITGPQAPRSPGGTTEPSTILFVTNHKAEFHQRPGTAPPTSSNQRQAASNMTRNNAINANNSNNFGVISRSLQTSQKSSKKPFNPFKKIQQALK